MKHLCNVTRRNKGFTLVELLLFMGLFSVIMVVLTTLFSALVQKQLEVQTISAVESDATYLLSRLRYDVARADAVITPGVEGETGTQLVLSIGGADYTYALNGSTLELTTPTTTYRLNSIRTTMSNVSFQRLGNPSGNPTIKTHLNITSIAETSVGPETVEIDTTFGIK